METTVLNSKGEKVGSCELPEKLFGQKAEPHFLYEAVTAYLANQRRGTACAKTRAEISGGGKKPWKQKHTGRARHGSTRSPIWRKGGVVFGPRPHSFRREMPAQKRRLALAQALSAKYADNRLFVMDKLELAQPKTRELSQILATVGGESKKTLLVAMRSTKNLAAAGRNLKGYAQCEPAELNAYRVMAASRLVITKDALSALGSLWKEGDAK